MVSDLAELEPGGLIAGIDPAQGYAVHRWQLGPSDTLVAYSDGLPDARSFGGEAFGKDRLRASVLKNLGAEPGASASRLADLIIWDIKRFTGLAPRTDDMTVLVLRVAGQSSVTAIR